MSDARRIFCWLIFFVLSFFCQLSAIQTENDFVSFFSRSIDDFFSGFESCRISFLAFENSSFLKSDQLSRFYQLFATVLERKRGIKFVDNLIEMKDRNGTFDFSRNQRGDFFIVLKFIQDGRKLGLGLQIYSANGYNLVFFRYFAGELSPVEIELLTFQPELPLDVDSFQIQNLTVFDDLLDIYYWDRKDNSIIFVLFANRIEVYRWQQEQLKREGEFIFKFEKVFRPAQIFEGELSCFQNQGENYLAAGFNFYPDFFLFKLSPDGELKFFGLIEALPIALINVGSENFFLAKKYEIGKNFFVSKIYLLNAELKVAQFKELEPFYALYLNQESETENWRMFILSCQNRLKVYNHLFQPLIEQIFPAASFFTTDGQKNGFLQVSEAGQEYLQQVLLTAGQAKFIARRKLPGVVRLMRFGWLGGRGLFLVLNVDRKRVVQFWKLKNEKD